MLSYHSSPTERPGTGHAGGMNVAVRHLADGLAARGVAVDVFTRSHRDVDVRPFPSGVRLISLPAGGAGPLTKRDLLDALPQFTAALVERAWPSGHECTYDVIHTHYWLSGLAAVEAAHSWVAPIVHSSHSLGRAAEPSPGAEPEPARRLGAEARVLGAAAAVIATSPADRDQLVGRYSVDSQRVHVVPLGVDPAVFHPGDRHAARSRLGLDPDSELVLFVGRLHPDKGPDVLVDALAILSCQAESDGVPSAVLLGSESAAAGTYARLLRDRVAVHGLESAVQVRRAVPHGPVLADWLRAASVVVVPSRAESFGLVAAEARACGAPVLAAAVGGLPWVLGGQVSGVTLVEGHHPADWAAALRQMLRTGVRAVPSVPTALTWDRSAEQTERVYHVVTRDERPARLTRRSSA